MSWIDDLKGWLISGNGLSGPIAPEETILGAGLSANYDPETKKATLIATAANEGISIAYSTEAGSLTADGIDTLSEANGILLRTVSAGRASVGLNPAAVVENTENGRRIDRAWIGGVPANITADFNPVVSAYHIFGYRKVIASAIGADRSVILGVTGAIRGDTIEVVNYGEQYNIHVLANSILTSLPPGWGASAEYTFDGTVWQKTRGWTRPIEYGGALFVLANKTLALCDSTADFSKFNRVQLDLGASMELTLRNGGAIKGDVIELQLAPNASTYTCTVKNAAGTTQEIKTTAASNSQASRYLFNGTAWGYWHSTG